MKKLLLLFTALLAVAIIGAGCGDDDDEGTSPNLNSPLGYVNMSIYLDPEAYMDDGVIYGIGAIPPNIDSMKIGDSLLYGDDFLDYDYDEEYHENFWECYFSEDGSAATYMYRHGDMAQVRYWGDNGMFSSTQFTILDADSAEVTVVEPVSGDDTVAVDESITVHWDPSDGGQFYSVWLEFREQINGSSLWTYKYFATADTFFTVTPDMYPDSLYYMYVSVTPFTGPDPSSATGNVTGGYLTGRVFSFGWYDYTQIYGWNIPPVKAMDNEDGRRKLTEAEMIRKVYEQK